MKELSIILCSHNQVQYLERCIMSIINQSLPFDYEIILSDDASTDGTWELAQKLAMLHPQIKKVQCDTRQYPCYTNSQRSGYNRQCAYKLVSGKYIVFIDADDYYKEGTRVLIKQYESLENHPECAAAMANNWILNAGAEWDTACFQDEKNRYIDGQIISAQHYMDGDVFRSCTAFMFRNLQSDDVKIEQLKGFYADTIITAYYLQFGNIICLDNKDSGYVYVQYPKSASHNNEWRVQDWYLWASRCIFIPALIHNWQKPYLLSRKYRGSMLALVMRIRKANTFNQDVVHMFDDFDMWIYAICRKEKRTLLDKLRLFVLEWFIRIPQYVPIEGMWWYNKIWKLMI